MRSKGASPIIAEVLFVAIAITAAIGTYIFVSSTLSTTTASVSTTAATISVPPRVESALYDYETNTLRLYVRAEGNLANVSIYVKSAGQIIASALDVNSISCSENICIVEASVSLPPNCDGCYVSLHSSSGAPSSTPISVSNHPVSSGSVNPFAAFADWDYNKTISIGYSGADALADYQIRVELNSDNFNFSLASPDGNDIRFADMSGKELNYWIQEWNAEANHAIVWVRVPRIDPPETNIIMFYGNPSAKSESNGYRTFLFFDDFEGNSLKPWWAITGGTVGVSSGCVYPESYGSGSSWHGVTLRMSGKSVNSSDIYMYILFYIKNTSSNQLGILKAGVFSPDGNAYVFFSTRDSHASSVEIQYTFGSNEWPFSQGCGYEGSMCYSPISGAYHTAGALKGDSYIYGYLDGANVSTFTTDEVKPMRSDGEFTLKFLQYSGYPPVEWKVCRVFIARTSADILVVV